MLFRILRAASPFVLVISRTLFANLICIFFAFYGDFQQFYGNVKNFADFA